MTDIKYLVRVANVDLDGKKPIYHALRKIKGVSFMMANAICRHAEIDLNKIAGTLNDQEIKKIQGVLENLDKFPLWILNRRKDIESGQDKHLITVKLKFAKENDIKRLQRNKTYRGLRHAAGLPVRGQRTKSHFRHGKTIGVSKKAVKGKKG